MNYEVAALRSLFIADRLFLGIGFCHFEYDVQYLHFIMICTFIHLEIKKNITFETFFNGLCSSFTTSEKKTYQCELSDSVLF